MRFAIAALMATAALAASPVMYDGVTEEYRPNDEGVNLWQLYDEYDVEGYNIDADWLAEDYSKIPVNWFMDGATDLWKVHKEEVWDTAVADAREQYGELVRTCVPGNECRRQRKGELITKLRTDWVTLIQTFENQVKSQLTHSKDQIETTYAELVQCAEDAECCPYDDTAIRATLEVITGKQKRINVLEKEIKIRQAKLDEIANECPTEWAEMEASYEYVAEEESRVDVLPPVSGEPMGTSEVVETTEEIIEESTEVIEETTEEVIEESSEVIETVVEEYTTEEIITEETITTEELIEVDPEALVEDGEVLTNEDPAHIEAEEESDEQIVYAE